MSLTHLFNYKFFVENIKKSKGIILLLSLVLPVFTLLMLSALSDDKESAIKFWQLGSFNIFLMYVLPVVLSVQLFSFVFKKKSCDFIGSMPIPRKTLFVTNTLGGIVILVLIQAVTAILSLVFAKVFTSSIIFGSMIWDVFVFFTIAHIFVFVACNLAISISGNQFSTAVSLLLILFLIPFFIICSRIGSYNNYYDSYNISVDEGIVTYFENPNLTAPSLLFESAVWGTEYEYNTISLVKTIGMTIIYFILGLYLFNRKEYESAEESYENNTVHICAKALTLAPFVAVLVLGQLYEVGIALTFWIAIVVIYYIVFDMITNKKIKVSVNISAFLVSVLAMIAIFKVIVPNIDILYKKSFDIFEVKKITINSIPSQMYYENDFGLEVEDEDLIMKILIDNDETRYYSSIGALKNTNLTLYLKNGKRLNVSKWMGSSFKAVIDQYGNDKYVAKEVGIPVIDGIKLTKEEIDILREDIAKDLEDITIKEYYDIYDNERESYYLTLSDYRNHKLTTKDISYGGYKETTKDAIKIVNANAVKKGQFISYWSMAKRDDFMSYVIKVNPQIDFSKNDDAHYFDNTGKAITEPIFINEGKYDYKKSIYGVTEQGFSAIDSKEIYNFIKEHKDESFNYEKPYLIIYGYGDSSIVIYSNDIEGFYKTLAKAYNDSDASYNSEITLNENI